MDFKEDDISTDPKRIVPEHAHPESVHRKDGALIAHKYKIVALLGSGGMGSVYRVTQIMLNKDFAMKLLDRRYVSDSMHVRRFQQEAKAAFSLDHPNVVKVHDFGLSENDQPYLVMDFVQGITLSDYLKQHGPMSVDEMIPVFAQICAGLAHAHNQSIVHRDIKPANIMLTNESKRGGETTVKIFDFGIAKIASTEDGEIQALTRTGEVFGSPLYMSPEQCMGGMVDRRTDIYSLGCVLFEILTGTPPHVGTNALRTMMLHTSEDAPTLKQASLGKDFPEYLELIVATMLQKDPNQRYANVDEIAADLAKDAPRPRSIQPKSVTVDAPKSSVRRNTGIVLAVMTVAIASLFAYQQLAPQPQNSNSTSNNSPDAKLLDRTADNGAYFYPEKASRAIDEPTPADARKAFAAAKTIRSTLISRNGKLLRHFDFPTLSIGAVRTLNDQLLPLDEHIDAAGPKNAPNCQLMLELDDAYHPEPLLYPSILDKIDPAEFTGLRVIGSSRLGAGLLNFKPKIKTGTTVKGQEYSLAVASKWTNLQYLSLDSLTVTDPMFASLRDFKHLKACRIDRCEIDAKKFLALPLISGLQLLNLHKFNTDSLIDRVASFSNLATLMIIDCDLSDATIYALKKMPKLTWLILRQQSIPDPVITAICSQKKINFVQVQSRDLSSKQIEQLLACPQFRVITFPETARKNFLELNKVDPRVRFEKDVF